jgi:hypothetical protein
MTKQSLRATPQDLKMVHHVGQMQRHPLFLGYMLSLLFIAHSLQITLRYTFLHDTLRANEAHHSSFEAKGICRVHHNLHGKALE